MPFDGILTHYIAQELNDMLSGGRIGKIYQLDRDAVIFNIRANGDNHQLLVTCNAASPRVHLTSRQYEHPDNPPVFCMLLRKHLSGAIIHGFRTTDYERILIMEAEATDELGDRSIKKLMVEIMGRHSNIVLLNRNDKIIDAIKHVDSDVNRIRELLPARTYILPPSQNKLNPDDPGTYRMISERIHYSERKIESFLLDSIQGFSPTICRELCALSGIDDGKAAKSLNDHELKNLISIMEKMMSGLRAGNFTPTVAFDPIGGKPVDFHVLHLTQFSSQKSYSTINEAIEAYYQSKQVREISSQKTAELVKIMGRHLEKCEKRLSINLQTLDENKDFESLRLFGELITSAIYSLEKGMDNACVLNYYDESGAYVNIPLDKDKSPQENAQMYFKKYNKSKNAYAYAKAQVEILKKELSYLESVMYAIDSADNQDQLMEIRHELFEQGYLKANPTKGRKAFEAKSSPVKILSEDGFEIYIGRNNKQNDKLTLKSARHDDLWLHIKNFSGSHVVIKTEGKDVPDSTLIEAAQYAAWFSKARFSPKAEVDYTAVRNVKKPSGSKPGMVIYVNYYTVLVTPKAPEEAGRI